MKQKTLFRGIATALATPMTSSGAIDYDAYGRLIDWQIESGVAGLVTCGTTGEASTMTAEEHRQTIAFAVKRAAERVPVTQFNRGYMLPALEGAGRAFAAWPQTPQE